MLEAQTLSPSLLPERQAALRELLAEIGILERPNLELYHQALLHSSYAYENQLSSLYNYERLEFLGDAVLKLIISELLFERYPDFREGELTKIRSVVVSDATLAELANELNLGALLLLGLSEHKTGGATRPSNLACAFEALLGALFMDGHLAVARSLLIRLVEPQLEEIVSSKSKSNYKATLQELTQSQGWGLPEYLVLSQDGPSHDKTFHIEVQIKGQVMGNGSGKTKKGAQQAAALMALEAIEVF